MTPIEPTEEQNIKKDFNNLSRSLGKFLSSLIDLEEGIDREGTVLYIKNNKRMRGANAWMLMCSIMIASLGLDLNSPAIIIGAMLISPLMSPILGIGMGIGTNDRDTLIISLQHFSVAIAIALITSFLYFYINPLGQLNATKEIVDRTEPTLLAGLVAIFGGLAGIISSSRKDQSSAIPGVAIATALMPPLCAAGYGIARGEWSIFLNAFYLFFLNSFFIAISTFVMIRYMKFPFRTYPNEKEKRRTTLLIVLVSILLTIPSVLILRKVYIKKQHEQTVGQFIKTHFGDDNNPQSLGYSYTESDSINVLAIKLLGKQIDKEEIKRYESLLSQVGIKNTRIYPLQDDNVDLQKFEQLQLEISGYSKIVKQLELTNSENNRVNQQIELLQNELDSLKRDSVPIMTINEQVTTLIDLVDNLTCGYMFAVEDGKPVRRLVCYVTWNRRAREADKVNLRPKIQKFLSNRFNQPVLLRDGNDS